MPLVPVDGPMRLPNNTEKNVALTLIPGDKQQNSMLDLFIKYFTSYQTKKFSVGDKEKNPSSIVSVTIDKKNYRFDLQTYNNNGDANFAFQIGDETVACWFIKPNTDYPINNVILAITQSIQRANPLDAYQFDNNDL